MRTYMRLIGAVVLLLCSAAMASGDRVTPLVAMLFLMLAFSVGMFELEDDR